MRSISGRLGCSTAPTQGMLQDTMADKKKPLSPTGKKNRFGKALMQQHVNDHWVQQAQRLGYRSRAAFKLAELAEKDRLFRPSPRKSKASWPRSSSPGSRCCS
jgi:hypothetical protein